MALFYNISKFKKQQNENEEFTLLAREELRWFDYWLKGIDNGIMKEPPITFQVMSGPKKNVWKIARQWPLPEERRVDYYFARGPSRSVKSANDGLLDKKAPRGKGSKDDYKVDYTATSGTTTRWDNTVGGSFGYPDMAGNDAKGLTYTTPPLKGELDVTGHPVAHIWTSSTATDGDFFAYLEEVDPQGVSQYVTEGELRASHRSVQQPPYDNLNLPYHRSYDTDMAGLKPGEPVELVFDLEPTSNAFDAGNRIRLTITCADKDNARTPVLNPAPTVTIYRDAAHASFISLPVIGEEKVIESERSSKLAIGFIVAFIIVLVIAFTFYVRSRLKKK